MNISKEWEKQTLTAQDIARILKCGKNMAYNLMENGEIHSVKIGVLIRISMDSFQKWIEKQNFTLDKTMNFEDQVYTIEEIREILNIGKNAAYSLLAHHYFQTIRIGKSIRISKKSFDEWLK